VTIAVLVLAHEPTGVAAAQSMAARERTARERLRATLDGLWSEEAGAPARIVVHAGPELAVLARREHGRRVEVWPADEALGWADTLDALAGAARQQWLVWLRLGARVTPGWLGELVQGLAPDDAMVGPRLSLGVGVQAAHVPASPSRAELRQAATRLRFEDPRVQAVETLAPACVGVGQRALARVGRFDARYASLTAVLLDFQARLCARGGQLCVARRALVHAAAEPPMPAADAQALAMRRERFAVPGLPAPAVALELEADALDRERRAELANALLARGLPLFTFSRRTRPLVRPTAAPHHVAATLEAATRGAALVLSCETEDAEVPSRRLVLGSDAPAGPDALVAPDSEPRDSWPQRLDAWALQVEAAARAAAAEGEP
jgi:hypothetical protein